MKILLLQERLMTLRSQHLLVGTQAVCSLALGPLALEAQSENMKAAHDNGFFNVRANLE